MSRSRSVDDRWSRDKIFEQLSEPVPLRQHEVEALQQADKGGPGSPRRSKKALPPSSPHKNRRRGGVAARRATIRAATVRVHSISTTSSPQP
eukprot:2821266-Prymnesium_polylepis.1